jgi:hypothetical protein
MAWTRNRTRVLAIALFIIVIATSIALRKAVPSETIRMAIGMVEVVLIAILVVGIVRSG